MWLAVEQWQLHYMISQLGATGMVLVWNFLGNRLWTFGEQA